MDEQLRVNSELITAFLADASNGRRSKSWLAEKIGVERNSVVRMVRDGDVPNGKVLKRLAVVMGVAMDDLLVSKKVIKRSA
jgi:ribosome-binding protein aMBF1 (putative translation factor)